MNKVALALVAAALALPAAGCGSASSSGAAGASQAPAAAKLFVSIDTSFDSGNWEAGRRLLANFPDGDSALGLLMNRLGGQGVDFERDVKPALGPETDLVGLDLSGAGKFVGLTQPEDGAKLDALLAKGDQPLVSRRVGDWTAFSDSEANLDEFERLQKEGTLDGVDAYNKVSDKVAGDALVHVYVAGSALQSTPLAGALGSDQPSLALSLKPEDDGVHVQGAAAPATSDLFSDEFKAELPAKVPGGVFLYTGTNDLERQLGALRDLLAQAAPGLERDLGRVEAEVGVSLDEDLFPLFSGESALYVRPGFPIPEVTIVTQVDDEQAAVATLDKVAKGLAEYVHAAQPISVQVDGVQAKQVAVNQLLSIYYAAFDGHLVVTTSRQGIADLRATDGRLADDQAFKDAIDAAGVPDQTTGFLYVDLAKTVPALLGLVGATGQDVPGAVQANLAPLRSLVVYGERDGDVATFSALLAIQ
jgi:hypothetical protein